MHPFHNVFGRKLVLVSVTLLMILVMMVLRDDDFARRWLWLFFGVQFLVACWVGGAFIRRKYFFFSPAFLLMAYVNVNFFIGGYALYHNISLNVYYYRNVAFHLLSFPELAVSFALLCSMLCVLMIRDSGRIYEHDIEARIASERTRSSAAFTWYTAGMLALIGAFSLLYLDLSFVGGSGNFSTIPKTVVAVMLMERLARHKASGRWLIYIAIFLIFVFTNFDSKRESVFLLMPILLLENVYGNMNILRINFRKIVGVSLVVVLIIYAILVMTIARGFGGYALRSPVDAVTYVPSLIEDYDIAGLVATTSEAPTTTYHSLKAIDLVIENPHHLTYGSTFAKVLFVPLPRQIFSYKPQSMTTIFTGLEDPVLLRNSGSLPVNVYAELFWNFHILGLLFLPLLLAALNAVFRRFMHALALGRRDAFVFTVLYAFTYLIGYFRGFGLDLYLSYVIIAFIFASLWFAPVSMRRFLRLKSSRAYS